MGFRLQSASGNFVGSFDGTVVEGNSIRRFLYSIALESNYICRFFHGLFLEATYFYVVFVRRVKPCHEDHGL